MLPRYFAVKTGSRTWRIGIRTSITTHGVSIIDLTLMDQGNRFKNGFSCMNEVRKLEENYKKNLQGKRERCSVQTGE